MDQFDIIVVGGGSAGCAAAARLAENPSLSVCLLEAGGTTEGVTVTTPGLMALNMRKGAVNWGFDTEPQPGLGGRRGYQPRGRGLGGSSAINAMLYVRGNPWDYDNWAALGCSGWGWDDVLPWFLRSEGNARGADAYHGADGPLSVVDQTCVNPASTGFLAAAQSLQLPSNPDFNGAQQDGFGLYQVTQKNGERWSAARAFLTGQPNLEVRTGVTVEKILFENRRASGVQFSRGGQQQVLQARAGVVLSAGAFASPQVLMLSGIGPAQQLAQHGITAQQDSPAVGEALQDHVDYVGSWMTQSTAPIGITFGGLATMLRAFVQHRRSRTGLLTSPMAEAGGFWRSRPDLPAPDVQFHFVPAVLEDHGRKLLWGHGISCHACVLRPESRGTVRLASARAADAPLIDMGFLNDPRDMAVLRDGVRLMHRIIAAPPLAALGLRDRYPVAIDDEAALDALIRSRADTVYHPVGTCRMGSDAGAVVDPQLRARGVVGLWVADASVMPKLISGNTNAPSIMIGERCADFVQTALKA